jgi:hypothetical protein
MEDVGLFYGHSAYFGAIRHILWPVGIFHGYLVYFSRFGMLYQRKIWQPCPAINSFDRLLVVGIKIFDMAVRAAARSAI